MSNEIDTLDGEDPVDDLEEGGLMKSRAFRGGLIVTVGLIAVLGVGLGAAGMLLGGQAEEEVEETGVAGSSIENKVFDVNRNVTEDSGPVFIVEETDSSSVGELEIVRASDSVDQNEVLPVEETNVLPDISAMFKDPGPINESLETVYEEEDIAPVFLPDKSQSSILVARNLGGGGATPVLDVNSTDPRVIMENLQQLQGGSPQVPSSFTAENNSRELEVVRAGGQTSAQTNAQSSRELNVTNNSSSAARLAIRRKNPFVLSQGAYIDCVLKTQLNSQLAGLSTCQVLHNVYSDNGDVLLIERGSTVTGQYQTVQRQGINRVLIRWVRIRTPQDVLIDIDSPATDPVGGSGIPGFLDNQFFKRFGGALLLSIIFDAKDAAFDRTPRISTEDAERTNDTGEQIIEGILTLYAGIQPTIEVDRGSRVGILVARDLDFEGVYELQPQ